MRLNIAVVLTVGLSMACVRTQGAIDIAPPTDQELQGLVRQLATMRGRIIPAGSAIALDFDTTLVRRITSADARAVPLLVDCLSDTTPSEVGIYLGAEYVVRVAAVCYEVLTLTDFFQSRIGDGPRPQDFPPYVRYDAPPETWREAQAAWRRYLSAEDAKRARARSSYD